MVVQLLKSWEYKNNLKKKKLKTTLYSYLNLESTKTIFEKSYRQVGCTVT